MKISANFDSGNIEVISIENPEDIQVKIRKDTNSDFLQWFYFRLVGAEGYPCKIKIVNAAETSYPFWEGYHVVASYDKKYWFRVPTRYDGKNLIIDHKPEYNSVFYAYFAPYSYERHLDLISNAQHSGLCVLKNIGETVEGRNIDCLIVGEPDENKKKIWIIARQHPGESMAEWFMEGLIYRLLDESDPVSRQLTDKAVFYIVPNMNVDGSIHGNLRSNAAGRNLNREWENPDKEKSPEVFYVRNMMDETGVDLCLDVHGDEELPYNFVTTNDGIPCYTEQLKNLEQKFITDWKKISPDFQDVHGYDKDEPGKADLSICSNQIGQRFDCLSMTIEMPFKDNANMPDPIQGWSPERAAHLGQSVLNVVLNICDELR
jgi:murein tripeptide amidase MpaA